MLSHGRSGIEVAVVSYASDPADAAEVRIRVYRDRFIRTLVELRLTPAQWSALTIGRKPQYAGASFYVGDEIPEPPDRQELRDLLRDLRHHVNGAPEALMRRLDSALKKVGHSEESTFPCAGDSCNAWDCYCD